MLAMAQLPQVNLDLVLVVFYVVLIGGTLARGTADAVLQKSPAWRSGSVVSGAGNQPSRLCLRHCRRSLPCLVLLLHSRRRERPHRRGRCSYPEAFFDVQVLETYLNRLPPPSRFAGFEVPAPVLVLPNVFEPEFCAQLIALYEQHGGAVVFSCSLLHAVAKMTCGRHYAFLPFLYDEEAAKIREANNAFLSEGVDAYEHS